MPAGFGAGSDFRTGFAGKELKRRLSFVQRIFILLVFSNRLNIHDWLSVLLGTLSCAFYVIRTYTAAQSSGLFVSEVFFSVFFCIEYFVRVFVIAEERIRFVFSWVGLADLLAGVLPMVGLVIQFAGVREGYYLSVFLVFRAVRVVTSVKTLSIGMPDVNRAVLSMVISTVCLVFCSAGVLEFWESESPPGSVFVDNAKGHGQRLYFHDFVYYVVVTIATLGYGDVTPVSDARLVIVLLIVLGLFIIPAETSRVLSAIRETSRYGGTYALSRTPFIVLAGSASAEVIISFLTEFFTAAHGVDRRVVVILRPIDPEPKLRAMVRSARYAPLVVYLRGSVLSREDRHRAKVAHAESVVLLADEWAPASANEDGGNIMRALALREESSALPVMLCLLRRENASRLVSEAASLTVCTRHLHSSLLARALACRGLSTLLLNLIGAHHRIPPPAPPSRLRRFLPDKILALLDEATRKVGDWGGHWEDAPPFGDSWLAEFDYGYCQGLWCVPLGTAFEGYTLVEAAAKAFCEHGVLLLAVQPRVAGLAPPPDPRASVEGGLHRRSVEGGSLGRRRSVSDSPLFDRGGGRPSISGGRPRLPRSCSFRPDKDVLVNGEPALHVGPAAVVLSAGDAAYVVATSEAAARRLSEARHEAALKDSSAHDPAAVAGVVRLRALQRKRADAEAPRAEAPVVSAGTTDPAAVTLLPQAEAPARFDPYRPYRPAPHGEPAATAAEERVVRRPDGQLPLAVRDHFVIVSGPRGLRRLLAGVARGGRPVAVLAKGPPPPLVQRLLRDDPSLWYVEGSPARAEDLLRAGVPRAAAVLIRSASGAEANAGVASETTLQAPDSEALLAYLSAVSVLPDPSRALVELVSDRSLLRTPPGLTLADRRILGGALASDVAATNPRLRPAFATGAGLCRNFLESILCQAYFLGHNVVRIFERALDAENEGDPCISLLRVPQFAGSPYEDLFLEALAGGWLPLGLYRTAPPNLPLDGGSFAVGDEMRFVFTNPHPRTSVRAGDLMYAMRKPAAPPESPARSSINGSP